MENKINIAQLLKEQGVPSGTEFYTTTYGNVTLKEVDDCKITFNCDTLDKYGAEGVVLEYGNVSDDGECVLFPSKYQRDWSKYKYEKPEKTREDIRRYYVENTLKCGLSTYSMFPDKIQAIIDMLAVADYLNGDWIVNWSSHSNKFAIELSSNTLTVVTSMYSNTSPVIFKTKDLAKKAIEILGAETIRTALS